MRADPMRAISGEDIRAVLEEERKQAVKAR